MALEEGPKKTRKAIKKVVKVESAVKKDETSLFGINEVVGLVIITCVVSILFGYFLKGVLNEKTSYKEIDSDLKEFINNYNDLKENYYGELSEKELLTSAWKAVLNAVGDDYTSAIDTTDNNTSSVLSGEYKGIGIQISNNNSYDIIVKKVFENSPASKAGIKENDIIKKINDTSLEKTLTTQLTSIISKLEDNEFTLELLRDDKTITVKLKRDTIIVNHVEERMVTDKVAYLKISSFATNTYTHFKAAMQELENNKFESLIIDLRDNSGGHLSVTKDIMSYFVDSSHIIYQTKKDDKIEKFRSTGHNTVKYQIVILTNGGSASASEMLTGMLKDNLNAYQIGTTTFGKGTVQDVKTYGDIQYKYTTKEWLTPNGTSINNKGIVPELEIVLSNEYKKNPSDKTDNQLQEAIKYLTK